MFFMQGFHSIVLMATCDASYRFSYIDIGAYGSEGDANVIKNSTLGRSIINDTCSFPQDSFVGGTKIPYFIVGDDAFPLCKRIIKPFTTRPLPREERIFNYRLSRARRCIENAFGILSAKWLCLRKTLFCSPERAQEIVSACCLLHNYLLNTSRSTYCNTNFSENLESQSIIREESLNETGITAFRGRPSDYGKYIRNVLKEYVNSENGSVSWQNEAAFL